MTNKFILIIY